MSEIQSGRELCDQFFEDLTKKEDIDQKMVALLKKLHSEGKLTGENIRVGLNALRMEAENEAGSQT